MVGTRRRSAVDRAVVLLLVLGMLLAGCGGVRPEGSPEAPQAAAGEASVAKPLPGYPAADIQATDVATGEVVTLADLQGQPVFLNFWATWCPPCKDEMPEMEELHQEMGEEIRILAIGADGGESPEKMLKFAQEMELTFTVLHDRGSAARAYQVRGVPTSFFIDADGIIQVRHIGQLDLKMMKEYTAQVTKSTENE